jgi:uncharacterized membrane protein
MDITPWLKSLEDSGLATAIRNSLYDFPFLEAVHVMALSLVFGTITVVDLRLLGVASTERSAVRVSSELLKWTWGAFAVVVLTGAIMFTTNARVYVHNTAFLIKMALLALAGLNMAAFHLTAARTMRDWDRQKAAPGVGKAAAALSLALWIGVVVAGRVVGFTTTGAQAKETAPPPSTTNFDDFLSGGSSSGPPAAPASPAPK